jgi:predicted alpha/beta superfamily hydrolase
MTSSPAASLWIPYTQTVERHTVTGDLRVLHRMFSPQLDNQRDIYAWLPPDYESADRRYPVIYMHDGLNLFDTYVSNSGEWRVDETMTALSAGGLPAIIVGIPNNRAARASEYSPYANPSGQIRVEVARGDQYLAWVSETIKPLIDSTFRTLPGPATTAIAGSSMGGLISLYAFMAYPGVFGACGAFSPAFGIGDKGLLKTVEERASGRGGSIYLDVGGREGVVTGALEPGWERRYPDADAAYVGGVRELRDALRARGYVDGESLLYVEGPEDHHHEDAWARRLPDALRFLIGRMSGA